MPSLIGLMEVIYHLLFHPKAPIVFNVVVGHWNFYALTHIYTGLCWILNDIKRTVIGAFVGMWLKFWDE